MASEPKVAGGLSLEEFLQMPGIDECPYKEYLNGRVVTKVSPQMKHAGLTRYFLDRLNAFAEYVNRTGGRRSTAVAQANSSVTVQPRAGAMQPVAR